MENRHKVQTVESPQVTRNPDGTYSLQHTWQVEATLDGREMLRLQKTALCSCSFGTVVERGRFHSQKKPSDVLELRADSGNRGHRCWPGNLQVSWGQDQTMCRTTNGGVLLSTL